MATINHEWGKHIRDLLTDHGLTLRGAMLKVEGKVSHTTIKDWCDGIVPHDSSKAIDFLSYFPRDEAIECLKAGGIPVPTEWQQSTNPLERVQYALNGTSEISDLGKQSILDFARKVVEEEQAAKGKKERQ